MPPALNSSNRFAAPETPGVEEAPTRHVSGEVELFRTTRWLNIVGSLVAVPSMIILTWSAADHGVMLRYYAIMLALQAAMVVTYVLPLRRPVTDLPLTVRAGVALNGAATSAAIFLEPEGAQGPVYAFGVGIVLYACVAGCLATLSTSKRLIRAAVFGLLGPFIVGCALEQRWTLAIGTLLFVVIVNGYGVAQLTGWFEELQELRQEATTKAAEAEATAQRDPLTALLNRRGLGQRSRTWMASGASALYMDLDGFKQINDRLGHAAGDEVLVTVASRLQEACRNNDLVARLGGDEFVVVIDQPDLERAAVLADRILESLLSPITLTSGEEVTVGVSVGLAATDDSVAGDASTSDTAAGNPFDTLLLSADRAQYRAKQSGGNRAVGAGR